MELLATLAHEENLAVAAVLHQPDLAIRHADRAVGLLHGRISFNAPVSELTDHTLDTLYSPERCAS